MQSKAAGVEAYLAELPPDRRAAIQAVRAVVLKNLDKDYEEGMQCGMIGYYVPHRVYPAGYHCDPTQPLTFAGLASQKSHISLYLMCVYGDTAHADWFRKAWARAVEKGSGKRLDMGKSCVRFKTPDDIPLEVIGEAIRRVPAAKYIAACERMLNRARNNRASEKKPAPRKRAGESAGRG